MRFVAPQSLSSKTAIPSRGNDLCSLGISCNSGGILGCTQRMSTLGGVQLSGTNNELWITLFSFHRLVAMQKGETNEVTLIITAAEGSEPRGLEALAELLGFGTPCPWLSVALKSDILLENLPVS